MTERDDRTRGEGGDESLGDEPAGKPSPAPVGASPTEAPRQWHYPSKDEHPADEIFIYQKWCKSCGICYSVCPKSVLTSDKAGRPVVSNPDACIACGLCEILCPDMAITVHKKRKASGSGGKDDD
jgi:2-oxoglutarate ferredoxin oxidoreductase subunit delta